MSAPDATAPVAPPEAPSPAPQAAAPAAQPAPQPVAQDKAKAAPPTAGPSRIRRRHVGVMLSFVLWVLAPLGAAAFYLYFVAQDQFASHIGFTVRTEESSSAIEILGGITELSGSSTADADVLYEFIQSQQMVRLVNDRLDLAAIYTRPEDPFFSLGDDLRIEAVARHWSRMVKVFYDTASGLMEVRVLAFEPAQAQAVAEAIFDESSRMINELSAVAREDATRYARDELAMALERLKVARQAKITYQNRTQIVDPAADLAGRMGVLNSLQNQLAEISIERELLLENARAGDPRLKQIELRITAIRELIQEERDRFGEDEAGQDYARLLSEFEAVEVEREFAEKTYLSAQIAYDASVAEARRKSRYLASYVGPTLAETAEYPQRLLLLATLGGLLFISWSILVMAYYSLRDRR